MKLRILGFCIFSFFGGPFSIFSQSLEWFNEYEQSGSGNALHWTDVEEDKQGNVLLVGYFVGNIDADPSTGTQTFSSGAPSILIQKLSPSGSIVWTKSINGSGILGAVSNWIEVDNVGNVYVAGFFENSIDVDPGPSVHTFTCNNLEDGFMVKLDPNGNFSFGKQFRIGRAGEVNFFKVNPENQEILISTPFQQWIDVDPSANTLVVNEHPNIANDHGTDNSITICLDNNGNYKWHYAVLEENGDGFRDINFYGANDYELYPTWGTQDSVDVDPGVGVHKIKKTGGGFEFVRTAVQLNSQGNFTFAKHIYYGSANINYLNRLHVDSEKNHWLIGSFSNTVDIDLGSNSTNITAQIARDGLVVKYDSVFNLINFSIFDGSGNQSYNYLGIDQNRLLNLYGGTENSADANPNPSNSNFVNGNFFSSISLENNEAVGIFENDSDLSSPKKFFPSRNLVFINGPYTGGQSIDVDPSSSTGQSHTNNGLGSSFVVTKWSTCSNTTTSNLTMNVCGNVATSPSGRYTWNSSGTYQDTVYNQFGCDEAITVTLNLGGETTSSFSGFGCSEYIAPSGAIITSPGTYNDTIPNSNGCDSVMTITVSLGQIETEEFPFICDGETYTLPNGGIASSTGDYNDTLQSVNGCDSIITFHLVVNPSYHQSLTISACQSYELPSGTIVTQDGVYNETLTSSQGCDSSFTIDLTFGEIRTNQTVNSCFTYTLPNGSIVNSSGVFEDTLISSDGCDSIVTYEVTINSFEIDTINSYPNIVLSVLPSGAEYQWLTCPDYDVIENEINQTFTPVNNGVFAVAVTLNGCTDTSECMTVSTVGLDEILKNSVKVYPNPTKNVLNIEFAENIFTEFTLFDLNGRVILDQPIPSNSISKILDLSHFVKGVYILHLSSNSHLVNFKIVLE